MSGPFVPWEEGVEGVLWKGEGCEGALVRGEDMWIGKGSVREVVRVEGEAVRGECEAVKGEDAWEIEDPGPGEEELKGEKCEVEEGGAVVRGEGAVVRGEEVAVKVKDAFEIEKNCKDPDLGEE